MNAGDGIAAPVHGVDGACEVAGEDVAEQLAADRAATLRRAYDRDGARLEEGLERGAHRDVVARGHLLPIVAGGGDRKPDLQLAGFAGARHLESGVAKDAEHCAVLV